MSIVFLILSAYALIERPALKTATPAGALAVYVPWAFVVLGLGTIALLLEVL